MRPETQRSLEGKCAIVTGGAKGLGLAIAKMIALHGGKVFLVDSDPEVLEQAKSPSSLAGLLSRKSRTSPMKTLPR